MHSLHVIAKQDCMIVRGRRLIRQDLQIGPAFGIHQTVFEDKGFTLELHLAECEYYVKMQVNNNTWHQHIIPTMALFWNLSSCLLNWTAAIIIRCDLLEKTKIKITIMSLFYTYSFHQCFSDICCLFSIQKVWLLVVKIKKGSLIYGYVVIDRHNIC